MDIEEVVAAAYIQELKTGAWKKQLNRMADDTYEVEVYWFPWIYESSREGYWNKSFRTEQEAKKTYDNLTSMAVVRKLLLSGSSNPKMIERKLLAPPHKQDPWLYTVEELRRMCEENGLPADGKKEDLIYRLFKLETPPWAPAAGLVWSPRYHAWVRGNR